MNLVEALRAPWLALIGWAARREQAQQPANATENQRVGLRGEHAAYLHLRRLGYTLVARRWMTGEVDGELDLIAWHGEQLCFIEVKTRTRRDAFPAGMRIDPQKQRTLARIAAAYVRSLPLRPADAPPLLQRFDVVTVYLDSTPASVEVERGQVHAAL